MDKPLYLWIDFVLLPIYFTLIVYWARNIKQKRISDNPLYKYYTKGLIAKLFGGLAVCFIYIFHYKGGDTIGFFQSGRLLALLLSADTPAFFSVMAGNLTPENLLNFIEANLCCPDYYRDPQSFAVVRIAGPLVVLSGFNFFATTLLFSFLSYAGIWRLFLLFNELYPNNEKRFAISILYMPSLLFWGSAILKDTVTFSAACWFTFAIYNLFIKKERRKFYAFVLIVASYTIINIKPYIFVALLPGTTIWILYSRITNIRSTFVRVIISPLIIGVGLIGSSSILSAFSSSLGAFGSVDSAIDKAVVTKNDLTRDAYGENSFDIGQMDGSLSGIIIKFPQAVMAGLFRPYLWDVSNIVMLISALENTALLLFMLRIMFKLGPLRFFGRIFGEPLLIFSFVFVLFFTFALGLTTANFGALVRYKIPAIPFFVSMLVVIDPKRQIASYIPNKINDKAKGNEPNNDLVAA